MNFRDFFCGRVSGKEIPLNFLDKVTFPCREMVLGSRRFGEFEEGSSVELLLKFRTCNSVVLSYARQ